MNESMSYEQLLTALEDSEKDREELGTQLGAAEDRISMLEADLELAMNSFTEGARGQRNDLNRRYNALKRMIRTEVATAEQEQQKQHRAMIKSHDTAQPMFSPEQPEYFVLSWLGKNIHNLSITRYNVEAEKMNDSIIRQPADWMRMLGNAKFVQGVQFASTQLFDFMRGLAHPESLCLLIAVSCTDSEGNITNNGEIPPAPAIMLGRKMSWVRENITQNPARLREADDLYFALQDALEFKKAKRRSGQNLRTYADLNHISKTELGERSIWLDRVIQKSNEALTEIRELYGR